MRKPIATIALIAAISGYALAAERAHFILTNGEKKSGSIAAHGDQHENLINGYLNLAQDGANDVTLPLGQVAVIDFAGGNPGQDELVQLPAGSAQALVLRSGPPQAGRFVNMVNGDTLLWDNLGGQRQRFALRDVSRIYLDVESARRIFHAPERPVAAAPAAPGGPSTSVRVDAKQPWTDSGLTVNQGDRIMIQASGQIAYGQSAGQTAGPEGGTERRGNYPDPNVPVGTLLGKIGNSAPFAIGSQNQPVTMPASGRLLLGVNDNELGDNSGFFLAVITR